MIAAQVLSGGSSETARIVLIDKGSGAGLKPDLPVLVADGVVGKVLHVFDSTAQVLLITDPYSGVATLLGGSRVHGVVKGVNRSELLMEYVPNDEDVRNGQVVYTSGEDQIFPKGLPVGVVVNAAPGLEFQQINVQPFARLNNLEEVLVILQSGGDVGEFPMRSTKVHHDDAPEEVESADAGAAPEPAVTAPQSPAVPETRQNIAAPPPETMPTAPPAAPPQPTVLPRQDQSPSPETSTGRIDLSVPMLSGQELTSPPPPSTLPPGEQAPDPTLP
jgi:rod shape-determining protein MreC